MMTMLIPTLMFRKVVAAKWEIVFNSNTTAMTTTKVAILTLMCHKDDLPTRSLSISKLGSKEAMTTTKAEIQTRMFHRVKGTRCPIQFLGGVCTCAVGPGRKLTEAIRTYKVKKKQDC